MIIWVEFGTGLLTLMLAFAFPRLGSRWFHQAERALAKLAERRRLAVLVVGAAALAVRAALLPVLPIPEPAAHDEFSYLLAADTFAHGRLTNPSHPMWVHFETFHVEWHPTYASMYPPAQGIVLAAGQVLLGHPFWGVWLSLGLMCASLCWMLQGWLPPNWALLGGSLAIVRLATFSYWANSYWGGAVAATGGALVYGALPRLKESLRVRHAVALAVGLAILANSRPYEGLIFSLPVAAALLAWMLGRSRPPLRASLNRLVLPAGILLGLVAVFMGYYFWRVTGSPWLMPQQLNRSTYAVAPYFLGQALRPIPAYHHAVMKELYLDYELPFWRVTRSVGGLLWEEGSRVIELWAFYLLFLLTVPLLVAQAILPYGFSWRAISPGTRFLLLAAGFGLTGYALEVFYAPHYFAPGVCLVYALVLSAMRSVRGWTWRSKPVGVAMTRAIPLVAVTLLVLCVAWGPELRPRGLWPSTWCAPWGINWMSYRARMLADLQREPGPQLVLVRYSADHNFRTEWVYNRAVIDASKVVWARDMGPQANAELLNYYRDRRVWLVSADLSPPRISAYAPN